MEKVVAFCGITCSDCPTFQATRMNDDSERSKLAELWTKQYDHQFTVEDINCDGCQSSGTRMFNYTKICEIRRCGQEKKVKNCAHCDDYKCEKISKLHGQAPKAKETLDEIRKSLGRNINRP